VAEIGSHSRILPSRIIPKKLSIKVRSGERWRAVKVLRMADIGRR
jgi:hypothetical protein